MRIVLKYAASDFLEIPSELLKIVHQNVVHQKANMTIIQPTCDTTFYDTPSDWACSPFNSIYFSYYRFYHLVRNLSLVWAILNNIRFIII